MNGDGKNVKLISHTVLELIRELTHAGYFDRC